LTIKVNFNDYFELNYQENITVLALTLSSTTAKTSSQATTAAAATTTTKSRVATTIKSKTTTKLTTTSRQTTKTTTSIQNIKTGNQCLLLYLAGDKLKPTGQNLGRVFNFRNGRMHAAHLFFCEAEVDDLELKTWPKQL
jgi:hypothetical protein